MPSYRGDGESHRGPGGLASAGCLAPARVFAMARKHIDRTATSRWMRPRPRGSRRPGTDDDGFMTIVRFWIGRQVLWADARRNERSSAGVGDGNATSKGSREPHAAREHCPSMVRPSTFALRRASSEFVNLSATDGNVLAARNFGIFPALSRFSFFHLEPGARIEIARFCRRACRGRDIHKLSD
jgi:hypothetical protein